MKDRGQSAEEHQDAQRIPGDLDMQREPPGFPLRFVVRAGLRRKAPATVDKNFHRGFRLRVVLSKV
jgi:hypothetical protein